MKFLVDENVEFSVVRELRKLGCDVLCVAEQSSGCADKEVFDMAVSQERVLLTNDTDFGEMVFRQNKLISGIVLMRFSSESIAQKLAAIRHLLKHHSEKLIHHFTVVSEEQIRIRPL